MNYATYYINTGISCSANKRAAGPHPAVRPRGSRALHSHCQRSSTPSPRTSWYSNLEIVVGALLLLSPMFWLFIAELIK